MDQREISKSSKSLDGSSAAQEPFEVRFSIIGNIVFFIFSLFFFLEGILALCFPCSKQTTHGVLIPAVSVIIFFGFLLLYNLRCFFYRKPAIIIDSRGVKIRKWLTFHFFSWADIDQVFVKNVNTIYNLLPYICLSVKNPEKLKANQSWLLRFHASLMKAAGYGDFFINAGYLDKKVSEIVEIMNSYIQSKNTG